MCDRDTEIIAIDSVLFKCEDFTNKLSEVPCVRLLRFQAGQILEETALISLLEEILMPFASTLLSLVIDLLTRCVSTVFEKFTIQTKAAIKMYENKEMKATKRQIIVFAS